MSCDELSYIRCERAANNYSHKFHHLFRLTVIDLQPNDYALPTLQDFIEYYAVLWVHLSLGRIAHYVYLICCGKLGPFLQGKNKGV